MATFEEIRESLDKGKGCKAGVSDTCLFSDQSNVLAGLPGLIQCLSPTALTP